MTRVWLESISHDMTRVLTSADTCSLVHNLHKSVCSLHVANQLTWMIALLQPSFEQSTEETHVKCSSLSFCLWISLLQFMAKRLIPYVVFFFVLGSSQISTWYMLIHNQHIAMEPLHISNHVMSNIYRWYKFSLRWKAGRSEGGGSAGTEPTLAEFKDTGRNEKMRGRSLCITNQRQ